MITIRKYTPTFVDGAEDIVATVSSKESLLEIPFVKSWMSHDTFREFRVSNEALVAFLEEHNGEWLWFVVGISMRHRKGGGGMVWKSRLQQIHKEQRWTLCKDDMRYKRKRTPQDMNWFEEVARLLVTDEDFVNTYIESPNSPLFTEQAEKEIAEYLGSGNDMFDYLLTKQTDNRKEN